MSEAFYVREGSEFVATELTRGPWDDTAQHGGPPAALMGGALMRWGEGAERRHLARFTMELLRPIPIGRMAVEVEPVRVGRKADWLTARLLCEGKEVARGGGVRIAIEDVELPPPHCPPRPAPPGPQTVEPFAFPFFPREIAYHLAVDLRIVDGVWGAQGPMTVWLGLKVPLVKGEETTPLERMLALVDAQNGVCIALDPRKYAFVNPDLTVHLRRPLAGEWVGLFTRSTPEPIGTGLVQSELHDERGEVGRALQSLVVSKR